MVRLLFFTLLFASTNVWAAGPVITGITGASDSTLTGTPVVWGGLAGGDCSNATTSLCNSCAKAFADTVAACTAVVAPSTTSYLCSCNTARIHDTALLQITVKRAAGDTGDLRFDTSDNSVPSVANAGNTIGITWGSICGGTCTTIPDVLTTVTGRLCFDKTSAGNCNAGDVSSFTIKIVNPDPAYDVYDTAGNATGIGNFKAFPGDEKIYVDDPQSPTTFPETGYNVKIKKVRVYISTVNLTKANFVEGDLEPEDLELNNDALSNSLVDGLDNGQRYYLRLGMVDEAGNVIQQFPNGDLTLQPECDAPAGEPVTCDYSAIPDQVLGMLTKDFNCFIATAAYGTALEPKLKVFRKFRYHILLQHKWGVNFVKAYYKYGPYAARYIQDKPILRYATQAALWPLYGFSWLALKIGLWKAAAAAFILLAALASLPWFFSRERRLRA